VTPGTVQKKFKEKILADGCRCGKVREIGKFMDLSRIFELAVVAMQEIRGEMDLSL
jgi:predicted hydrolase (HD superfamily)